MVQLKKVLLIEAPIGVIKFVPLEDIAKMHGVCNYEIIIPDEKTTLMVYEKTVEGGSMYDPGVEDKINVRTITPEDIATITANNRECYVAVDYRNELIMPSNGVGRKLLVIHLTREEVLV